MNEDEIKYKQLLALGKLKELEEWRSKPKLGKLVVEEPKQVKKKEKQSFEKLEKIKGVGKETVRDLERAYESENALMESLEGDSVPLRNDVVKKLKRHYKVSKKSGGRY